MSDEKAPALDKAAILAARKTLPPVAFPAPGLGGTVYVARLTAGQVDQYMAAVRDVDKSLVRGTALTFALCGPDGARLFAPDDAAQLAELPAAAAEPVVDEFFRLNGLGARKN
jgi:hypothetical protein